MSQDYDSLFKVVVIGDSGVGKTNLVQRYTSECFNQESKPTIGVEFANKFLSYGTDRVKVQLWDTAGQERFRAITNAYYRGALGAVVVFDLTKPQTFQGVERWFEEVRHFSDSNIVTILVGNKADLTEQRLVPTDTAVQIAQKFNTAYIETSAQSSYNVNQTFEIIIKEIYEKQLKFRSERSKSTIITESICLTSKTPDKKKKKCC